MPYTSIIDFRHLLDPRGRIPMKPAPMARQAGHIARIVECATAWEAGFTLETPLRCRRRPQRRPCAGLLYLRRSEVPSAIVWICPICGDRGMVQHFAQTRWDLSFVELGSSEDAVTLSPIDYEGLWESEVDRERRALLARGQTVLEGVQVEGPHSHLAVLRARVEEVAPAQTKAAARRILQLSIRLQRVKPPVWRRIEIPSTATLGQLHRVVQIAMGWSDRHPHRFRHRDALYGVPGADELEPMTHERRVRVADLLAEPGDRMLYDYDPVDGWTHEIRLEGMAARQPGQRYPRCLKGRRACPPENIGGPSAYVELLEAALRSGAESIPRPRGRRFDPAAFDLDAINARLRGLRL
jgi:hypothetical protein